MKNIKVMKLLKAFLIVLGILLGMILFSTLFALIVAYFNWSPILSLGIFSITGCVILGTVMVYQAIKDNN